MMAYFVGGTWDGLLKDVGALPHVYLVAVHPPMVGTIADFVNIEMRDGMPYRPPTEYTTERYVRERVRHLNGDHSHWQYRLQIAASDPADTMIPTRIG